MSAAAEENFSATWPAFVDRAKALVGHTDIRLILDLVTKTVGRSGQNWAQAGLKLREYGQDTPDEVATMAVDLVLSIRENPLTAFKDLGWPYDARLPVSQVVYAEADSEDSGDEADRSIKAVQGSAVTSTPAEEQERGELISRVYGPLVLFERIEFVEPPKRSDEAVAQAFDQLKFIDAGGTKKELRTRVAKYASLWVHGAPFYAPYLALINASMTGKSRLIAELRFDAIFLISICLRPDKDENLRPRRTEAVAQWIEESARTPDPLKFLNECCAFHYYTIRKLREWLKIQPEGANLVELTDGWYHYLRGDASMWQEAVSKAKAAPQRRKKGVVEAEELASEAMTHAWQLKIARQTTKLGYQLSQRFPESKLFGSDSDVRILFVVDEARNLNSRVELEGINRFHLFRKSLQAVPYHAKDKPKIFAVFTDTISKVANIAPPSEVDPSGRLFGGMKTLFPPFTGLNTVDLWWNHASLIPIPSGSSSESMLVAVLDVLRGLQTEAKVLDAESVSQSVSQFRDSLSMEILEHFFFNALMGRPAYAAFLLSKASSGMNELDCDVAAQVLHKSLQAKLLCGFMHSGTKRKVIDLDEDNVFDFDDFAKSQLVFVKEGSVQATRLTQAQALGVLGAIASIEVSAASRLATELSAGHMRLVSAISKLRKFVYTKEVSEPVLALAAHGILMTNGAGAWSQVIDRYVHSQMNQSTMTGFLGEIACEVLLLMVWQRCLDLFQGGSLRVPFIPVFVFLEILLGEKLKQISADTRTTLKEMQKHLHGGWVRVNQVVLTISDLSIDMLCDYAIRASAIRCKPGQSAIDFSIPVYFPNTPSFPISVNKETSIAELAKDLLERTRQETPCDYQMSDRALSPETKDLLRLPFAARGITQMVFQVKDAHRFMTSPELEKWLSSLDGNDMSYLDQNAHLPTVAVCIQFDSRRAAEDSLNCPEKGTPPLVVRHQIIRKTANLLNGIMTDVNHVRYVVCIRRPRPSDIDPALLPVNVGFQRLLEYRLDVFASNNIDAADVRHNSAAIELQPKYRDKHSWLKEPVYR